jgi:hypothetical protein
MLSRMRLFRFLQNCTVLSALTLVATLIVAPAMCCSSYTDPFCGAIRVDISILMYSPILISIVKAGRSLNVSSSQWIPSVVLTGRRCSCVTPFSRDLASTPLISASVILERAYLSGQSLHSRAVRPSWCGQSLKPDLLIYHHCRQRA